MSNWDMYYTDDSSLRWEDCHCYNCGEPDKKCKCEGGPKAPPSLKRKPEESAAGGAGACGPEVPGKTGIFREILSHHPECGFHSNEPCDCGHLR